MQVWWRIHRMYCFFKCAIFLKDVIFIYDLLTKLKWLKEDVSTYQTSQNLWKAFRTLCRIWNFSVNKFVSSIAPNISFAVRDCISILWIKANPEADESWSAVLPNITWFKMLPYVVCPLARPWFAIYPVTRPMNAVRNRKIGIVFLNYPPPPREPFRSGGCGSPSPVWGLFHVWETCWKVSNKKTRACTLLVNYCTL